jgi:acyl transferase domain-containing protein/NAD(P)H-dependent flavin oxidoreductase YrpB (nitropropane dioxygenase family)/phosphopantetheinyl transferase
MRIPDIPLVGRVWNVFCAADLDGLARMHFPQLPILRLYDLSLLERLPAAGLEQCPVILSHLIDLDERRLPDRPAGLALEVANRAGLLRANAHDCDLVIGRSFEVPGPSRECSAFLLFQLLSTECRHPYYLHGNTGYELFQAYLALGVSGIVLPEDQFKRDKGAEMFRFPLAGGASLRLHVRGGAPEAVGLRNRLLAQGPGFIAESFADGLWTSQQDDLLSGENRPLLEEYLQLFELSPRSYVSTPCFYPDSPAARQLRCPLPIVQGPMANVTHTPAFARAVFQAGAFPNLALAGLSLERACSLLREVAQLCIPFGAGIVSVSEDDADLEVLIECFGETQPTLVVLAAPQLDHVQRLLRTGLNLAVHAPNGPMFSVLFDMGVRTFIIEGEEAGGHVSRIGSLGAWQEVLNEIRKRGVQHEVHLILAGGIMGKASAELITHLLNFFGMAGELKVSLQMGTAYLSTFEALELTPMPELYQKLLFSVGETIVTGETLHRNVRQLATPATAVLLEQEWSIFTSDLDLAEKKHSYERLYQGAHRRAITGAEHDPTASYLAGAVATRIEKPVSLRELHEALLPDKRFVAAAARHEPGPIAIVGVGLQIPGADSITEHFRNLLLKRCFIRDVPDDRLKRSDFLTTDPNDRSRSYSGLAGMIDLQDEDLSMYRIPPRVARELASFQVIALRSAHRALDDAGFFRRPVPRNKVATFVGVNGNTSQLPTQSMLLWARVRERLLELPEVDAGKAGMLQELFEHYESLYQDDWVYTEDTRTGQLASIVASRIANVFDLGGMTNTLDAACASGLAAVAQAISMLNEGRCDAALAGAVGPALKPDAFVSFSSLHALSAQGSFPFDARADGFVIGEGGGMFVLKRERDALLHGDRIYAVIQGWGASSDGAGKGITAPSHKGQVRALEDAYASSGIDPLQLDFLECHATGTPVGDSEERISVHGFFGEGRQKRGMPPLPIGGSKAMTGHLLSGAGVVSMLSGLFAVNLRRVPPQVNFEQAPDAVDLAGLGLKVATRPEVIPSQEVLAGVSAFGFGGVNYHLVLSTPQHNARAPLLDAALADFPRFDGLSGDTLFMFPGQGSQYPGMLHAFRDDAGTRELLSRAMGIFAEYSDASLEALLLADPALDEAALGPLRDALKDTAVSQPAIFLASVILLEKLREKGIYPSMAIGHSLGEYSAIYAAGMLGFDDAFRMVCIRGKLMSGKAGADPGAMVALACGEQKAREMLEGIAGYAACSNFNAYDQTVVSGESAAVRQLMERAEALGIRAHLLPVSRGFHSNLVADCEAPMVHALSGCDWRNAAIPLLANLSRQAYPLAEAALARQPVSARDKDAILSLLARHIAAPVDFISQVNAAYESGIRRFVEVGPKNILTRLVDQILQGKPFQTEALHHAAEPVPDRIDGLAERLRQPLAIKRQPLPAQRTAAKAEQRQDPANPVRLDPAEQVRAAVAEVSGYSRDQIRDDAEFERDLGIDTLKIFEILSRLRGTILPQEVGNFRQLTSIEKILAAVGAVQSGATATPQDAIRRAKAQAVHCYQYRTVTTGRLTDAPGSADPRGTLVTERLPRTLSATAGELLPGLHRMLRAHGNTPVEKRPAAIHLVTYAPEDEFYDGAWLALIALFRSAQKDIPATVFTYTHFDGMQPSGDSIAATLADPRIGRRVRTDGAILEGRLSPMQELSGERDRLPGLLTGKDVILVTGGARGITAEVVKSLIQGTGARFILLGRQARTEDWIEQLGPERVRYFAADLLDEAAIEALGLGRLGITLVFHGAGVEFSKNLADKSDEEFAGVLGIKAGGLERILSRLDAGTLRGVIQFSSVVSYVGNHGQADYAAANGILNGTLRSGIPALSIAWSAWDGVGMATRGVVKQIFEARGVRMIPLEAGIEVFERMLAGFLACPPKGTTCTAVFGATAGYQAIEEVLLPAAPPMPLSQYRLSDPAGLLEFEVTADLERHAFLKDHSFGGNVVTPACVMLHQFVATALAGAAAADGHVVRFEDTEFLLPLVLRHGETVRLSLGRRGDAYTVDRKDGDRSLPVMRTRMQLPAADDAAVLETAATAISLETSARFRPTPFDIDLTPVGAEYGLSNFGPAFDVLNNVSFNGVVLRAEVNLDKAGGNTLLGDAGRVALLFESAFFCCTRWLFFNVKDDLIRLPSSIGSCTIFPGRCADAMSATVYAKFNDMATTPGFDCVVMDGENRPLLVLDDYRIDAPGRSSGLLRRPLPRSAPFQLGASNILLLDLPQAVAWAGENLSLTAQEKSEIEALNSSKRRDERLAGKLAAKLLAHGPAAPGIDDLARYQVLSADAPVRLTRDGSTLGEQPYFSISHTDDLVCAARADRPVGIDVERVRGLPEKTVYDICGETLLQKMRDYLEQDRLPGERNALSAALPVLVFTQKEAVLKASGLGLAEGLDGVELEQIAINREIRASHRGLTYRVISTFNNKHVVSVAVAEQLQEPAKQPDAPLIPVPLSFIQESLYQSEQQRIDGLSYALSHRIHLRGELDARALRQALQALHRNHDVLRMGIDSSGAGYVRQSGRVQLQQIRLDDLAVDEADRQAESLGRKFAGRKYEPGKDPLYRVLLLRLPGAANLLFINFHHLVMDCFSSFDYSDELLKAYHHIRQGTARDGDRPQYAAFAARQRERLTPARLDALRRYWAGHLAGAAPVELLSRPQAGQGVAHTDFRISTQQHALIEEYCRSTGVTLFIGLLTAMHAALLGWLKRSEMIIGIPFSLRDRATESGMLGSFVNLLPIRASVTERTSWSALSHELRGALFDAIDHCDIPPADLEKICAKGPEGRRQQAAVICQLIYEPQGGKPRQELEVHRSVVDGHHPEQALVFSFFLEAGSLRCSVTRNTAFLDQPTLDNLILDFHGLIARMCAAPDAQGWQLEGADVD